MNPELIPRWRLVLKHAWSVRLMILAAVLSGLEVAFSLLTPDLLGVEPGFFAALAGLASAGALVARLMVQPVITDAPPPPPPGYAS